MPIMEEDGYVYGPTINGKMYKSMDYHRNKPRKDKTLWLNSFSRDDEFNLFDECDERNWTCKGEHYWGTIDGKRMLGMTHERFSHFPKNKNANVPWHG